MYNTLGRLLRPDCGESKIAACQILIVDDDPGALSLFKAILGGGDCLCTTAATAEEALEAAESQRFDLAILDLRLPGMSGAEAAWQLRQKHQDISIIAVSAYLNQWDREDLADLGVDRALAKPFSADDLRRAVAEATEGRAATAG